jgi:hypothetical protein
MLARDLKHGRLMPEREWNGWFVRIVNERGHKVETLAIADAPKASQQVLRAIVSHYSAATILGPSACCPTVEAGSS